MGTLLRAVVFQERGLHAVEIGNIDMYGNKCYTTNNCNILHIIKITNMSPYKELKKTRNTL